MRTRAGNFDRRITLFRNVESLDDNNAVVVSLQDKGTFFASRLIDTSVETTEPGKVQARQTVTFEMYFYSGKLVRPQDIIEFESRKYDVISIEETERRATVKILAVLRQ